MIAFKEPHLAEFRVAEADLPWKGAEPRAWAVAVAGEGHPALPTGHLARETLTALARNAAVPDEACFLATMAWGGMRRDHGRAAWAGRARLLPILADLRRGGVDRLDAYARLQDARVPNLGVAYFTKLIFALRPEHDGFIMDQWTGKGVCLLTGERFIAIRGDGWVTPDNGPEVYRRYCETVERLAAEVGQSGAVAERMLFSRGGKRPAAWRKHVITHWAAESARRHIHRWTRLYGPEPRSA